MATKRRRSPSLAKLLDSAAGPIYVLDPHRQIVFCNRALVERIGVPADVLVGCECRFHSQPSGSIEESVAAALCPPPEVFEGQQVTGNFSCPTASGDRLSGRVEFVPLGSAADDLVGVLGLIHPGSSDSPDEPANSGQVDLHESLRQFRVQLGSRYQIDQLLGRSPAIRQARDQATVAAGSDAAVLIVGPSGSGRQHVARLIHYAREGQSERLFVPLDCSVLAAGLLRSTIDDLEVAVREDSPQAKATLVLDDVHELPAEVQLELVRVLDKENSPLRIVATARCPLGELVEQGRFRHDLACLLGTITIRLPGLAQRLDDLPLLAQAVVEECNREGAKQLRGLSAETLDLLAHHPWNRNFDELIEVVRAAHGEAAGLEIDAGDLPQSIHVISDAARLPRRAEEPIVLEEFIGHIERTLITRALARSKGNKAKAARMLGMTRPRLYRRLVQLGLATEEDSTEADSD